MESGALVRPRGKCVPGSLVKAARCGARAIAVPRAGAGASGGGVECSGLVGGGASSRGGGGRGGGGGQGGVRRGLVAAGVVAAASVRLCGVYVGSFSLYPHQDGCRMSHTQS